MGIESVILGALGLIPSIFKHKPFQLWFWNGQTWGTMGGPMSSRQCYRQKAALIALGMDGKRFTVLRKGVTPPPFFNPPPVKGKA